jgi:hypothetical protein
MKKIFTITISLMFLFAKSQNNEQSLFYVFNTSIPIYECNFEGDTTGYSKVTPPEYSKFTIVRATDDEKGYIIRFWLWKVNKEELETALKTYNLKEINLKVPNVIINNNNRLKFNYKESPENTKFFLISKANLAVFCKVLTPSITPLYGAAVLPFKARPQNELTFTKDLTISNMGGFKYKLPNYKISLGFVLGIGISSVNVDSLTTKGVVKETQSRSAITIPIGFIVQYERLQFGIFCGWDWIDGPNKKDWIYQGKDWFSLGIGFNIFNEESAKKKEDTN